MSDTRKCRVGLLGLMLDLYDLYPDLKPRMADFANELANQMSAFATVRFTGVCNTRAQVDSAVHEFESEGLELIVVVLLTYAPSHIALPALLRTSLPVLILNTQRLPSIDSETTAQDTTENHGMHGVQDLCNVLVRSGQPFHLVTGHYQDEDTLSEVKRWCDAARLARLVRHIRIGQIGYAMEGMGDFGVDETALLAQVGISVHHIAMQAIAERATEAPDGEIDEQLARDRERFLLAEDITTAEHRANSRLEWALRQTMKEEHLDGFAAHFMAVGEEGWLDTLPFLGASKLLGEGYGFGGEGDVTSAAAVAWMSKLAGAANFCEMFTMDPAHGAVLMMHMGEGNWTMARRDEPVRMVRSTLGLVDLRVSPLLLAFGLEPGDVTLVSLTTCGSGRLKIVAAEGSVLDFPYLESLGRPHFKFKPDGELYSFLTRFSLAGGSHHQALAYGRWADTLGKMAELLGVDFARV